MSLHLSKETIQSREATLIWSVVYSKTGQGRLTPHSEKQRILRLSGAHSALTRPSAPASILAVHCSSLIEYTFTTARLATTASMYSESKLQAAWVIQPSEGAGLAVALASKAVVADGEQSTAQVWKIPSLSERRTTSLSLTADKKKFPPGLK